MSVALFPLSNVRLTGGIFAGRQRIHARHLMDIEPDRLLAPFRLQAGLEPRADRYGGWESRDISGHSLGHYLSALAMLRAATGNEEAAARVRYIVDELEVCQNANGDGYVLPVDKEAFAQLRRGGIEASPFALNGVWVPFYTFHKLLAGMRDAFRWVESDKALRISVGVADWLDGVLDGLTDEQVQLMLSTEHGGMNEVLADLTFDTGDPRYLALASRCFHHRKVLDPMFRGEDHLNGLHGNTQIPKVVGLAREFELGGNPECKVAAESFWEHVVNLRSYVIGGHGESEHFFPAGQFPKRLTPNTCETCNTYNLLKLTGHLFEWQPDAARMDFVERAMINHLAANIGREPGEFGYFLGLGSVGVKVFSTPFDSWWCCVGTGLENPVRYGEQAYARSEDALWVNLFMASHLEWPEKKLRVIQETEFPEGDVVRLRFECGEPVNLALKLRHPWWCESPELHVNGGRMDSVSTPSSYVDVRRIWEDGDMVEWRLPMKLHLEALPHSDGRILAVMHGPTVLAGVVPEQEGIVNPSKNRFAEHLDARGKTDAFPPHFVAENPESVISSMKSGESFGTFRSDGVVKPGDLDFVPFYQIYEEQYAVYFPFLTPVEWRERETVIRAERKEWMRIEAATSDVLTPGYQQPEVEHRLRESGSRVEDFSDRKCRVAEDGGWFSYEMAVDPAEPMALVATYWGGVWHQRVFEIHVNGRLLAIESLLADRPGEFFDRVHELPPDLTAGVEWVTVRFQSRPGDLAGGLFGLRVMRKDAAPRSYEADFRFKDH